MESQDSSPIPSPMGAYLEFHIASACSRWFSDLSPIRGIGRLGADVTNGSAITTAAKKIHSELCSARSVADMRKLPTAKCDVPSGTSNSPFAIPLYFAKIMNFIRDGEHTSW